MSEEYTGSLYDLLLPKDRHKPIECDRCVLIKNFEQASRLDLENVGLEVYSDE